MLLNRAIPFAKITLPFILGIVLQKYVLLMDKYVIYSLALFLLAYFTLRLTLKASLAKRISISLCALFFILFSGYFIANQQVHTNKLTTESNYLKGTITDIKKVTSHTISFEYKVNQYKNKNTWTHLLPTEKILVKVKKQDSSFSVKENHNYFIKGYLTEIKPPQTPNQVDFKSIYAKKNIFHFFYSNQKSILPIASNQSTLQQYKADFLTFLQLHFTPKTASFISALIANEKEYISTETKNMISRNGVSHLIAISGLHIGIIYLFLIFLTKKIPHNKRKQRILASLFICVILLLYGSFCGFSPSIARSVTMFCIMELATIINRKNNAINSLFVAGFVLLLLHPNELFHVGFQLSFAGVLAILLFYKQIKSWFTTNFYLLRKLGEMLSVTLSAQLGVFPILLFYFKTFSINGIFLSLLLTFLTTILVGASLLTLLFFKISLLTPFFIFLLEHLSSAFFWLLGISELFPLSIQYTTMTLALIALFYLVTITFFQFIQHKKIRYIQSILIYFILFFSAQLLTDSFQKDTSNFYIYNDNHQVIIAYADKKGFPFLKEESNPFPKITHKGNDLYSINKQLILFQNNSLLGDYQEVNTLYLSSKIPFRAIKKLHPRFLILDKKLPKFYIEQITAYLKNSTITIHNFKKDGYLKV